MRAKYLIPFFLLAACTFIFAFRLVDDPFEILLKKLAAYNESHPQEKIYLHLDKPYYAIGDNIWFKAYVTDTRTKQPSNISHALYVELINENDSLAKQIKLPLVGGISWGDFKLPDTLQEGNYRIRAYTQWMRNNGPDFFYDKTIKIGNSWANRVFTTTTYSLSKKNNTETVNAAIKFTDKQGLPYGGQKVTYAIILQDKVTDHGRGQTNAQGELTFSFPNSQPGQPLSGKITAAITLADKQQVVKTIPLKAAGNMLSVQLFPESGNLVENLPSKVGIKAVNTSGLGEEVSGTVTDSEGTELSSFTTDHLGMGSLMMNPEPGKTYTVKVKLKDGTVQQVPVPKALTAGYTFMLNNTDTTKISARIMISEKLLGEGEIKLVITQNNTVYAVLKTKSTKQVTTFSVAKKELPSGILHFTLFNTENLPVAERLVFVENPADQIETGFSNLKAVYGKRENVSLDLLAKDNHQPTQGSFSVAVTNMSIVTPDENNESNIFSTLLLTSDLKGYIEKPNYYFLPANKQRLEDLDNLMLTQGWTRFLWKELDGDLSKSPVYPAEKEMKVSGTITSFGGKPIAKGKVSLFSSSHGLFMVDTLTDDNGHFSFNNLSFGDSIKFVVQARNVKNKKNVEIKLDIIPGQVITKNKNTGDIEVNVNEAIQSYIHQTEGYFNQLTSRGLLQHSHQLKEVNITEKKKKQDYSSNMNGPGSADAVITAKDLNSGPDFENNLQGRVAGLMLNNGRASLSRYGGRRTMEVILDGVPMADPDQRLPGPLKDINTADVETVEILKSTAYTAIYGSQGGAGVIIITTKRGGDTSYSKDAPGIISYRPKGYYAIRQFYSPQYTPENKDQGTDQRSTVYWNPHISTAADGTAKFNFYNTDQTGTYRIVIEGINNEGHLARNVYTYEVK
ncbi:TonB-dependent receptor plug domain-containing protein [Pedobacter sp. L105]|uniref:TonB-dependent receptor plug domain-containing protein n=1 Tax=Pedobacter sp. L105 TaxID=1641871 RepID=UPI00131D9DBF|nr:TonB-dependent receptor plug domain-containing protein [Pedobacter sp. L105]